MEKPHIIMDSNEQEVEQSQATEQVEETERTDWKAKAIEWETKFKSEAGSRKRLEKDLKQFQTKTETPTESQPQDKKGFDYAEKAYLKSSGIEATDFEFVKEVMDSTGKDIDAVLGSKFFQAELKERKDLRMSEAATPSGSKRAGNTTRDQVDYWLAKGELPPDPMLRRQVVNARIKSEENKSQFTDTPVFKL